MACYPNLILLVSSRASQTPLPLTAGYQFVSYLPENPIDALQAVLGILDQLDFIRNSQGETLQKIGDTWVNNIGNMQPGEGYLFRMNEEGELVYEVEEFQEPR
ncbi:MAG: hypothetical protein K9I94_08575 [Bacteroidales bacterium]|nr:hypothetical protein [Bacteroidales bacterium]